jgi:hypothetical protein
MKWFSRHRAMGIFVLLAVICVLATLPIYILHRSQSKASSTLVATTAPSSPANACSLNPQTFLSTVNQWRADKGVAPLQYSTQLEDAAKARIADMEKYQYYGHTNPVTKVHSYTLVGQFLPATARTAEVLDGPRIAAMSAENFKNSPDHYSLLVDSSLGYLGMISKEEGAGWASYSNDGILETDASNSVTENCIVIADLADSVTQAPTKAASIAPSNTNNPSVPISSPEYQKYLHDQLCYNTSSANAKMYQSEVNLVDNTYYPIIEGYGNMMGRAPTPQDLAADNQGVADARAHRDAQVNDAYTSYETSLNQIGCSAFSIISKPAPWSLP